MRRKKGRSSEGHLDGLAASEQWKKLILITQSSRKNNDIVANRSILESLANVQVRPGSGTKENVIKKDGEAVFPERAAGGKRSIIQIIYCCG